MPAAAYGVASLPVASRECGVGRCKTTGRHPAPSPWRAARRIGSSSIRCVVTTRTADERGAMARIRRPPSVSPQILQRRYGEPRDCTIAAARKRDRTPIFIDFRKLMGIQK
ncbi:hypothetical protein BDA96_03G070000 [Sorghum bicolor]|uniref:Uncharacterized protein n=2 Tax=Sorghum bicolor TaxID=4558 RepID=A0A921RBX2_SORBI|nr:hypothetical protein BDA96_03G070000 [Sorghum bicolor]KXG31842.1 hypothetical protein SORBI_3003G066400 [Sorghum bicolor]